MHSNDDPLRNEFRYPTAQEIQRNMYHEGRLRDEAIAAAIAAGWRAFRILVRNGAGRLPGRSDRAASDASATRTTLAAIRSSAERLPDEPELTPAQRAGVVGILLAEERRLVLGIAGASRSVDSR